LGSSSFRFDTTQGLVCRELELGEFSFDEGANAAVQRRLRNGPKLKRQSYRVLWKAVRRRGDDRRSGKTRSIEIRCQRHDEDRLKDAVQRVALPNDDRPASCLFLRAVSAKVSTTKDRRVSPDVLVIEVFGPGIKASSRKFIVFGGGSSEACEVPARRVGLSNDDEADAFARTKVQRLGRSEKAILVQRFDGSHANKIAQRSRLGSRRIRCRSAQRTKVKLRKPSVARFSSASTLS
jgi:hypothetical protein